jgi:hypothetical protein
MPKNLSKGQWAFGAGEEDTDIRFVVKVDRHISAVPALLPYFEVARNARLLMLSPCAQHFRSFLVTLRLKSGSSRFSPADTESRKSKRELIEELCTRDWLNLDYWVCMGEVLAGGEPPGSTKWEDFIAPMFQATSAQEPDSYEMTRLQFSGPRPPAGIC